MHPVSVLKLGGNHIHHFTVHSETSEFSFRVC